MWLNAALNRQYFSVIVVGGVSEISSPEGAS